MLHLRWRSLFRRSSVERELDDELQFHLEKQIEENIATGMSERDARSAALRQFGDLAQRKEECRDARRVNIIQDLIQDLRYAFRTLRKSPVFAAVAVVSLALGIGANTAIFTLINALLLRTLPLAAPEQLVMFERANMQRPEMTSFPYPFYRELRDHNSVFQGLICQAGMSVSLSTGEGSEPISGELVSGNYFEVLGVKPYRGRFFGDSDNRAAGQGRVAVLSYNFWKSRFGGDLAVVGKPIYLNTIPMIVLGVTPPGFDGLDMGRSPDVRVPVSMQKEMYATDHSMLEIPGDWWLDIAARLKPGITRVRAEQSLQPFLLNYLDQIGVKGPPPTEFQRRVRASERMILLALDKGQQSAGRGFARALKVLMGITAAVLLIACLNLANLLLARTAARQHEIAVRMALGAGRRRLIRQLVTESLLLTALGGACAIGVAYAGSSILLSLVQDGPQTFDVSPGFRVLGFTFGLSLLTGLLIGLAPALQSRRARVHEGLSRGSGRTTGERQSVRRLLIGPQVALSLVLLTTAVLFAGSLHSLRTMDTGFNRENVVAIPLDPTLSGLNQGRVKAFYRDVLEKIRGLPGVVSASYAQRGVIGHGHWGSGITVEGYTPKEGEEEPLRDTAGPGFFHTLSIPILSGREFGVQDGQNSPRVAVVNEKFARFYFGNQSPLGRHIDRGGVKGPAQYEIVGVVKDVKYASLLEASPGLWYIPYEQREPVGEMTLFVRTAADQQTTIGTLRRAIAAVDRNVPVSKIRTLEVLVDEDLDTERLLASLSIFFSLLAASLASIGLYGVMAYSVGRRTREIGIRMALGAANRRVLWMVLREALGVVLLGVAAGVPLVLLSGRLIANQLYGVKPGEPWTIAAAAALMLVVAGIASYLPARRAAGVDPLTALRQD